MRQVKVIPDDILRLQEHIHRIEERIESKKERRDTVLVPS